MIKQKQMVLRLHLTWNYNYPNKKNNISLPGHCCRGGTAHANRFKQKGQSVEVKQWSIIKWLRKLKICKKWFVVHPLEHFTVEKIFTPSWTGNEKFFEVGFTYMIYSAKKNIITTIWFICCLLIILLTHFRLKYSFW